MAHGKDASRSHKTPVGKDKSAVVEWRVLEEDILDEAGVYVGIDYVAGLLVVVERNRLLDDDKCAGLGLGHRHASIYHRHHPCGGGHICALVMVEECG